MMQGILVLGLTSKSGNGKPAGFSFLAEDLCMRYAQALHSAMVMWGHILSLSYTPQLRYRLAET
jgi:hypothetical protein